MCQEVEDGTKQNKSNHYSYSENGDIYSINSNTNINNNISPRSRVQVQPLLLASGRRKRPNYKGKLHNSSISNIIISSTTFTTTTISTVILTSRAT
jgi:hypothetical protein